MKYLKILIYYSILFFGECINKTKHLILNDINFVSLIGPVTSNSVDAIIWQWNTPKMLNHMKQTNQTILYINSPGGYVQAGTQLIQYMKSIQYQNISIHCIGQNFMSMAFIIFQSCNFRYILEDSIGMQHQMSFGVKGNIESIRNHFIFHDQINNLWIQKEIDRINITKEQYLSYIINDWWIYGIDNIILNTADEIILFSCDPSIHNIILSRKERITSHNIYYISYHKCPLYKDIELSDNRFLDYYNFYLYPDRAKQWSSTIFI